jgi:phosphopantothenoylcysteine decarboxylase/phosphopantothenate--cysteine ligase
MNHDPADERRPLAGRHILVGVSGGIAAYKAPILVRRLRDCGAEVQVVTTRGAEHFVTSTALQAVSGRPVRNDLWDPQAEASMGHIELARWADLILIAPATADLLSRLAMGRADDLLTTLRLASRAPVLLAPAMNVAMWEHPATQRNVARLREDGVAFVGPADGAMACGEFGPGRMAEPEVLLDALIHHFASEGPPEPSVSPLAGRKVLITAGPTREPIDPVRYISNHSSGKQGYALAAEAKAAGAEVTLISGPVTLKPPAGVEVVAVVTAQQMHDAVMARVAACDLFIGVAAVADYRPAAPSKQKLKKAPGRSLEGELLLIENPDIIAAVAAHPARPFVVGFAAETHDALPHARDKRVRKGMDMIVVNDVSDPTIGFNSDQNRVTVIWDGGELQLDQCPKDAVARALLHVIAERLPIILEPEIFRAYDIRGIADGNLAPEAVYWIGRAFAAEALRRDQRQAVIGRDGRHSSVRLRDALVRGLTEGGVDVLDAGQIPTPLLYYAAQKLGTATGIMITGSHNPPAYNGLKMLIGGDTLAGAAIQALRVRLADRRLSQGHGEVRHVDVTEQYLAEVADNVELARPLKVVVDCGNGVAGVLAPRLLERLGCQVIPLYCDVDGDFPNHHPDPADPANLVDLIGTVRAEGADVGIAFDGDGDRIGVVSNSGRIIWPDRLLMLFAQDVIARNPGADVIFDVKCSRHLNTVITDLGGHPILWKTGHSHLKAKLQETQAALAGEFSGHICFGDRWYGFDDALYTAARLLEILGAVADDVDTVFDRFPDSLSTPEIKVATTEQEKFAVIERLVRDGDFGAGTLTTLDGLRVDFTDGWGLIRASNTSPVLTLRFEADDQAALERIQAHFQDQLSAIDNQLRFR